MYGTKRLLLMIKDVWFELKVLNIMKVAGLKSTEQTIV